MTLMSFYLLIAVISSLIFIIQLLFGLDDDFSEPDRAFEFSNALSWLTIRNLIGFCLGFGWSGYLFLITNSNIYLTIISSVLIGFSWMISVIFLFKLLKKCSSNGNQNLEELIGKKATVIIPFKNNNTGKVFVNHNGYRIELDAISYNMTNFENGEQVNIVNKNGSILIIEKNLA